MSPGRRVARTPVRVRSTKTRGAPREPAPTAPPALVARLNRRVTAVLRRSARELLESEPDTVELLRPVQPDVASDGWVLRVLDLCMQVGEVLLSSGEAAGDTSGTMERLAGAYGLATVDVDITFTSITMCCHRGTAATPVTSLRLLRYRTTDLTRLAAVNRIVDLAVRGDLDLDQTTAALAEAVAAPHPYPRWAATAGWAGLAFAVALQLGAPIVVGVAAFVVTGLIDRLGRQLAKVGVAPFFLQIVGGFVATTATLGLAASGVLPTDRLSLVVAANITVLLSGLSVVGAVQDSIGGSPVTAAGRAVEIVSLSAGLLAGVVVGLQLSTVAGIPLDPAGPVATDATHVWRAVVAAAVSAAMLGLAYYSPLRWLAAAAIAGGLGWAAYGVLTLGLGAGPVVSTALAAVVIGLTSQVVQRTTSIDRHVVVLAGIVPLLPGLTVYRGLYQLTTAGDPAGGLVTIVLASAIGLALAAGVAAGRFVARGSSRRTMRPGIGAGD